MKLYMLDIIKNLHLCVQSQKSYNIIYRGIDNKMCVLFFMLHKICILQLLIKFEILFKEL